MGRPDKPGDERGDGFVSDRPAADVIAGVCGDLGLEPDLSLWTDEGRAAVSAEPDASGAHPTAFEEHRDAAAASPPHSDDAHGRPP